MLVTLTYTVPSIHFLLLIWVWIAGAAVYAEMHRPPSSPILPQSTSTGSVQCGGVAPLLCSPSRITELLTPSLRESCPPHVLVWLRRSSMNSFHQLPLSSVEISSTPLPLYTVWAGSCFSFLSYLTVCQNCLKANQKSAPGPPHGTGSSKGQRSWQSSIYTVLVNNDTRNILTIYSIYNVLH